MYILYYVRFTSPTNILARYTLKRSRCENRKLVFRKKPNKTKQQNHHTLPLKHQKI